MRCTAELRPQSSNGFQLDLQYCIVISEAREQVPPVPPKMFKAYPTPFNLHPIWKSETPALRNRVSKILSKLLSTSQQVSWLLKVLLTFNSPRFQYWTSSSGRVALHILHFFWRQGTSGRNTYTPTAAIELPDWSPPMTERINTVNPEKHRKTRAISGILF